MANEEVLKKEAAAAYLQLLQYDYADGRGDYGPVITQFGTLLDRYHQSFVAWQPYEDEYGKEIAALGKRTLPMLKTAAVLAAVFGLICLLFKESLIIKVLFYIAAGIAMGVSVKEAGWAIGMIGINLAIAFLDALGQIGAYHVYACWVLLGMYALNALKLALNEGQQKRKLTKLQKRQLSAFRQMDDALEEARQALIRLTPRLREEYAQVRSQLAQECSDVLSEREQQELCAQLPQAFWWDVSIYDLLKAESQFMPLSARGGDIAWETRWVRRQLDTAFAQAGEEFSPLTPVYENEEVSASIYEQARKNLLDSGSGYVLDFVSKGTSSTMEERTVQYEDYKYPEFDRFNKHMLWLGLGNRIDRARESGELTQREFEDLRDQYLGASLFVSDAIDRKELKEEVTYRQVKTNTNIWTGQLLMMDDDEADRGLAIVDYRSQIPHLFENLDSLATVKVTRVLGDAVCRNPVILAKIHRVCPECR